MAKVRETKLTFSVTITQPKGVSIRDMRAYIIDAIQAEQRARNTDDPIKEANFDSIKCHLTNKEVHYG